MAQTVPYKIYTYDSGGMPSVDVAQGSNTPYGSSETDFQGLINAAAGRLKYHLGWINTFLSRGESYNDPEIQRQLQAYNALGGDGALQKLSTMTPQNADFGLLKQIIPSLPDDNTLKSLATGQATTAGYINDQGNFQTANPDDQKADTAKHEAAVAAGTEKKVAVGNGFGYIPTGSPGDLLATNPQAYYQQYGGQPSQAGTSGFGLDDIRNNQTQNPPQYNAQGMLISGGGSVAGTGTTGVTDPNDPASQLSGHYAELYNQMKQYLDKLTANGQSVNPNIEISPDQIAAFTKQAEGEINPYYANQLKLARNSLLTNLGYSTNQIQQKEQDLQKTYGNQLRTLAENAADQGFAQSGIRQRQEGDLAYSTQRSIDTGRQGLENSASNAASQFAQQYGTSNLPDQQISGAPRVLAGNGTFDTSGQSRSLYSLSPETYNGLVGSQEYQQKADVSNRVSDLESAFNQKAVNQQQRTLTL